MNILHLNGMIYAALHAVDADETGGAILTEFETYVCQRTVSPTPEWSELTKREIIEGVHMLQQLVGRT